MSSAADVRAQWRPAILPGPTVGHRRPIQYDSAHQTLEVTLRNAGRGPALYVRVHLEPGGHSPEAWSLGALAADQLTRLRFRGVMDLNPRQLLIDYRDLAGRLYSTAIVIDEVSGRRRFYDVRLHEDIALTPLGDAIPQPGLTQVGRPDRTGRFQEAWRAFRRV